MQLIKLLRDVLDPYSFSLQSAKLTRERRLRSYNDDMYNFHIRHPKNAPKWTYKAQKMPVDTDISEPNTPIPIKVNDELQSHQVLSDNAKGKRKAET